MKTVDDVRLADVKAALEPFAKASDHTPYVAHDRVPVSWLPGGTMLTIGDLRRARALLDALSTEGERE